MTTFEQTREVVIPNNGSTVDRQPMIKVHLSAPLGPNTTLMLYINGVPSMSGSIEISPTEYAFSPQCNTGVYTFRVDVIQTDGVSTILGTSSSNARNITVKNVNHGWSSAINQDGPYALGNAGTSDNSDDFNWHDSFWLALVGHVKPTDIVEWETVWAPGSDGNMPPVIVQHLAQAGLPRRLELQARLGSKGSVSYSSGVMTITLFVNGVARGDVLELTLEDDQTDSHAESATWRVWTSPTPPSIHLSNSVTMLPVDNSAGVVWYDFVVPGTNAVVIDTMGGTADTQIALYDALGNFIASDDDGATDDTLSSMLTFSTLTPGVMYYLAVGEFPMNFSQSLWQASQINGATGETIVLNANLSFELPVANPFSITWDYSSSANGNLRTDTDLPPVYGTPTPGVSRYLLKDGLPVTASMAMHANAGPNTVLQPGDIVIIQGVMHVGTLTGTVDAQTHDSGNGAYLNLSYTVTEHPSAAGNENLQLVGEQDVDWACTRTLCNYPLSLDARTFTLKALPYIDPVNGACNFWYGPFFTLTPAEMAAFVNGSELTAVINGLAVYRGGVTPANLICSDVNRELFKMTSEIREDPATVLVQDFSASPLAGTAPLTVVYQDLSNFPTTDVSYTVTGPQLNVTTDTIAMQGVYSVTQEVRRPDLTLTQVTKTDYLTVNERTYPSDAPYIDIFRDEYDDENNGVVTDIVSHVPNLAPSGAVVTGTNVFTTGNGYVHREDATPMALRVDVARPTNANFDYKLAWTMAFAQEVVTDGTLFFAHIFGNDYDGMNGGNPGYVSVRVFRQAGIVRLGLTLYTLNGQNYVEASTELLSSTDIIYDCELILTPAGSTFKINGETLNNVFDSSTWGNSLTAFQVTNVVNAIYLNRMRMAYKPVVAVVLQEDFNGSAGTFVPRAPTWPANGWLTDHATPSGTWPSMVLDGTGALVTPFVNSNFYNGGIDITKQVDTVDPVLGPLTYGIPTQISSIEFDISTGTAFRTGGTVGTYVFAMYLRFAAEDGGWEDYLSLSAYRDQNTGQASWEYRNDFGGNYDTQTLPLVFTANTDYLVVITKVGASLEIRVDGALIWTVPFVQGPQPLVNANLRQHSGKIHSFKASGLS